MCSLTMQIGYMDWDYRRHQNMKDGFIRVAAATTDIKVADPQYNSEQIIKAIDNAIIKDTKIIVFPELCLTAYSCQDLFLQSSLIDEAKKCLGSIIVHTKGHDIMAFVGLPWRHDGKLYNTMAAIQDGRLLALITKTHLPNYSEYYEVRHFTPGDVVPFYVDWNGDVVPFGSSILLRCENIPDLVIAGEICEDVWVPDPPSIRHAMAGATVIVNSSASDETVGKDTYRKDLICGQSARLIAGYIYANAGEGESTQDLVFGGHNIIAENGICLNESKRFQNEIIYADLDLERLRIERQRMTTYDIYKDDDYIDVDFVLEPMTYDLQRRIDRSPFVPNDMALRNKRCEDILNIQAMGLKKRLIHTKCQHAVLGISGGLDSTLALLVTKRAFAMLGLPAKDIHAVTMPCFGTTDRTYNNACLLTQKTGATLQEINIKDSVTQHLRDIGHDLDNYDVTYENAQARERTQVLMDIANKIGGMVIGTGDLSELALGWATYNGDHMSMYGVNASVPKTLVRHLVRYYADTCGDDALSKVLLDILDTPVSPELLPPTKGDISQKTEDLVGPYELHDFFLYNVLRFGYSPSKIYRMAQYAFGKIYDNESILKWLKTFYRRFFNQQFKRSCLPDGPKVGSVAVSPRGDLRMPSDASSRVWLDELERIK